MGIPGAPAGRGRAGTGAGRAQAEDEEEEEPTPMRALRSGSEARLHSQACFIYPFLFSWAASLPAEPRVM